MNSLKNKLITGVARRLRKQFPHRILFLHIPKCGGTSIVNALSACYGPRFADPSQFRLDAAAVFQAASQFNEHFQQTSERLLLYAMAQNQCRFITGHFFFSEKAADRFSDQWQTVTMLRDPVSRWFSQYFFNRYKKGIHYKVETDLEEYIESDEGIGSGRTLVNLLEGSGQDWVDDPEQGVNRAIANLEKISLVGVLEHIDQFCSRFKEHFGAPLRIGRLRRRPAFPAGSKNQITKKMKEEVKYICRYDSQIYEYAVTHLL